MEELNFDIVVVGGGPAGSSAAHMAAKNGCTVALIEKEKEIAETVRTSGVTWISDINEFGIPKECYNPIKKFSFCSPKNYVTITDNVAKAAVLDVRKTYRFLATRSKSSGSELFTGTNVSEVLKNSAGKCVGVVAKSQGKLIQFNAKVVIDASGFTSIVAKELGYVTQWKKFGAGAEFEVKTEKLEHDNWWLMVGQEYSPAGYAWIFPTSKNTARIGVGVGKPDSDVDPTVRLNELIDKKIGPIKDLGNIEKIEFHYGLIPNEGLSRKTVYDNLILVGDSAGQANPLVLEGIRYAIRFGEVAGKVAANAVKNNDTSESSLIPYEKEWKKAIESKINSAVKVQNRWVGLSDDEWDKELDIINELTADEFLDFIRADFGVAKMVKLATHHPKMMVRQLFNMVKGT
ncbi:MAG: NAD(P)/FAD-dependent oxidoreductase [Thaumarchaeota archaeon]|nr:NAD(P)/FAD-dependent oxidoreductase [Nitrososphaerota archaeon]MBT3743054.1 NAD(P)/FAD-dependent oxidoreductase [Nitrososphaerota archaeon]MBT4056615.1 NAD(P)/FAD-dependent oxidoreductase [Nitrososphaerota archaeon]MBT4675243.1 NAD(P)/FAD-dependent oxidoreductase [Nitrososphaerota archaeon]MBT5993182.1 NAD(P)/FAD-dependent oxidoreductase [Nitrososphaerota archaeon]